MNDIENKALKLFQFLQDTTGCDLKELEGQSHYSGTLGAYLDARDLFTINSYIQNREYEIAYEKGITFLKKLIYDSKPNRTVNLIDYCKEMGGLLLDAANHLKEYADWISKEKERFKTYLFSNELLKEEEKTENFLNRFNYEWIALAKKSAQSDMFQIYNFGTASNTLLEFGHKTPYSISDALIISDDLNLCTNTNKASENDICHVRMALKIERELVFSYFVIMIQYKDKTWLVTDKSTFANPYARQNTRNPYRWREDVFDNIQLPYGLIDDIAEWRRKSKDVVKTDSSETYIKSIRDFLPPASKILIKLIIEELIYNVIPMKQYELHRIGFAGENIKLLGTDTKWETKKNDVFYNLHKEANDNRINNIVYPVSSKLVTINPVQAVAKYVEDGMLCTVEEMQKLAIWSQKEEQRRLKQKLLDEAHSRKLMEADEEKLNKILFDNINKIYEVIFSADRVYMYIEDESVKIFGRSEANSNSIFQICDTSDFKSLYSLQYVTNYHINKFRDYCHVANCVVCDCANPTNLQLKILHYKQLCGMLRITRNELPYTFQNYTAYMYVPYYGNPILNNVNPEYMILDPRSKGHPNYYSIGIPLNKRCFNKLKKKYWKYEQSLVVINHTKGTIKIQEYNNKTLI